MTRPLDHDRTEPCAAITAGHALHKVAVVQKLALAVLTHPEYDTCPTP